MTRIIAGSAKGARLTAPKGNNTRPTTDRAKEALFSSLTSWFDTADAAPEQQLAGVAVLDLFAGSGGLGLEAASRGASRVLCVDHRTGEVIRDNARRAGLRVAVRAAKAQTAVAALEEPYDLVLIDPPYDMPGPQVDRLLGQLADSGRLLHQALVVVERSSRDEPPQWPSGFTDHWERRYGETKLYFGAFDDEEQ